MEQDELTQNLYFLESSPPISTPFYPWVVTLFQNLMGGTRDIALLTDCLPSLQDALVLELDSGLKA